MKKLLVLSVFLAASAPAVAQSAKPAMAPAPVVLVNTNTPAARYASFKTRLSRAEQERAAKGWEETRLKTYIYQAKQRGLAAPQQEQQLKQVLLRQPKLDKEIKDLQFQMLKIEVEHPDVLHGHGSPKNKSKG